MFVLQESPSACLYKVELAVDEVGLVEGILEDLARKEATPAAV